MAHELDSTVSEDQPEKTLTCEQVYKGSIIRVEKLTVAMPGGKTASRDVVRHQGASAVVPFTKDGNILLVSQYRKPNECVSIEIPAGKLDPGESPETCAMRELEEETGFRAKKIQKLFAMHSTPGFSDEIIHVYVATELEEGMSNPDEDEYVSNLEVSPQQVREMVRNGQIKDGKTIAGIYTALDVLGILS